MTPGYWRKVVSVLTGTGLAQGITVVSSLVLARLYAPTEFGVYSAWLGVVLVMSVTVTGRFETALAIAADGNARREAVVGTLVTVCVGSVTLLALAGLAAVVVPGVASRLPVVLLVLLVPSVAGIAFSQTWQSWAAADGRYRTLSLIRVCQAVGITIGQVVGGLVDGTASSLALGYLTGVLVGLCVGRALMPISFPGGWSVWDATRDFWRVYRRFPLLSLPADMVNAVSNQLPMLVVASRFGPETAGYLGMATRVLGGPTALLGKSVLDVFKRHAAEGFRERGDCRAEYLHTAKVLLAGSSLFCALFWFFGEDIVAALLGSDWLTAGTIAVWLVPLYGLRFVASPLGYVFYIANKQHMDLVWQSALLCLTALVLTVPPRYDIALQLYSVGYALMYGIYLRMSYRFSLGESS